MSYFDEDTHTEYAANAAAHEPQESDDTPVTEGTRIHLVATSPDLFLEVDGDEDTGVYKYLLADTGISLAHKACGKLPTAEAASLLLYAITSALLSVTRGRISERLCDRYGYCNRRAALASHRKLMVQIGTTDPDLARLGQAIADSPELDVLDFVSTADRAAYGLMAAQLRRFDVRFVVISVNAASLVHLDGWAAGVLAGARHTGPIFSRYARYVCNPAA